MVMDASHVLVVDDCQLQRRVLVRYLEQRFARVVAVATLQEARIAVATHRFSRALVDLQLPDGSGLALLPELRRAHRESRVVIWTAYASIASTIHALRLGADDYLVKPASLEQVAAALEGSLARHQTQIEPLTLGRVEWEHIHRVLFESNWNVSEAARRLGIRRQALQRKLRKHPDLRGERARDDRGVD